MQSQSPHHIHTFVIVISISLTMLSITSILLLQYNNIIYYKKIAENCLRHIINEYDGIIPTILEIPAKEYAYEAKKVIILV